MNRSHRALNVLVVALILLVLVVASILLQTLTSSRIALAGPPAPDLLPPQAFDLLPAQARHVQYGAASLDAESDAVDQPTAGSIQELAEEDLAGLHDGMVNVTLGPRSGYRLLPHMQFGSDLTLRVPYDPELLPSDKTVDDIQTFFFDEEAGLWLPLDRIEVDTVAGVIVSRTDHFTDVINATVSVPDQPDVAAFTPTSISGISAADPSEGINLIEPPRANNKGETRLFYPLEVPPGLIGMDPSLGVSYNSSGANGWMGLGWDLQFEEITVDTRWGVPRYDGNLESETYMLAGEQLTPVAHRSDFLPREPGRVFHTRIEDEFKKIVRHGDSPTTYWWEVTDKFGTRSFYGGTPETGAPIAGATLGSSSGIFRWALVEVRDPHGNAIRYGYDKVMDVGQSGGSVLGSQLYLDSINYTANGGTAGKYDVKFYRDSELAAYTRRPDVMIDATGGFKMVTAELLGRVDVEYDGALVRRYDFEYEEGAFRKTLLKKITQFGEDESEFNVHEFEYFDDIRDPNTLDYLGFDPNHEVWDTGDDGVDIGLTIPFDMQGNAQASALSGATSFDIGGSIYAGYNPSNASKDGSFGLSLMFSGGRTYEDLVFTDFNGDNLPDKVFDHQGMRSYRPNLSGPHGTPTFGPPLDIYGLQDLGEESVFSLGIGPELYYVVAVMANVGFSMTNSISYLEDINGDGLLDQIRGSTVNFGYLDQNGDLRYTTDSNMTPVPIGDGVIDGDGLIDEQYFMELQAEQNDDFPLVDVVRRWTAPWDGTVAITGDVTLSGSGDPDGVRAAIQHQDTELWSTIIPAGDGSPRTPTGVAAVPVARGDQIYFRVGAVFDGTGDVVDWDPEINYANIPATADVNGLDASRYRASEDFILAGRKGISIQAPFNGVVRLEGALQKTGVTSDDITVLATKNGTPVVSQSVDWDQTGTVPINLDFDVTDADIIQLRVQVDSNIDATRVTWTPSLYYLSSPDMPVNDPSGDPMIVIEPPYDIDFYPINDLTAPQTPSFTVAAGDDGTVEVTSSLTAPLLLDATEVVMTLKKQNELLGKGTIEIDNGVVTNTTVSATVAEGDEVYVDFSLYDGQFRSLISGTEMVQVVLPSDTTDVPAVLHSAIELAEDGNDPDLAKLLFPQPYRGWAVCGYNGNNERAITPIDASRLVLETSAITVPAVPGGPRSDPVTASQGFDASTAKAWPFYPAPGMNRWQGGDDKSYLAAASFKPARLATEKLPSAPTIPANARGVQRYSVDTNVAVEAGVSLLGGSIAFGFSRGKLDVFDMNGDRFPDIIGNGRIQYTTPTGGLEDSSRTIGQVGDVRAADTFAGSVGAGGNPPLMRSKSDGETDGNGGSHPKSNKKGNLKADVGGSLGGGISDGITDLMDLNGDGLPDRVRFTTGGSGLFVALNLGYGFAAEELWGNGIIADGSNLAVKVQAGLGFNNGNYGFGGGLSFDRSDSRAEQTLMDLNGDGLLDHLKEGGGDVLLVAFNTGAGFTEFFAWPNALTIPFADIFGDDARPSVNSSASVGGGGYFTIGFSVCYGGCYIILNPGIDFTDSRSRQEMCIVDVDGDGFAEHVKSTAENSLEVARNRTNRTNLIKTVHRPLGGTITMDYGREGNTYEQPTSTYVLARVEVDDGHPGDGQDVLLTTFEYADGHEDRLEREFYGFTTVTEQHRNFANEAIYRSIVREHHTDAFYTQGLEARETLLDAAGNVFLEVENTYASRNVTTGVEPADLGSTTATVFVMPIRTDHRFYEGTGAATKSTFTTSEFDEIGNLVQFVDSHDVGTDDDLVAEIEYASCPATYIVGVPNRLVVRDTNGTELRRREAVVECITGDLTEVREFLADGSSAVSTITYNANGTIQSIMGPENLHGQRYRRSYEYDPDVATHVSWIQDSFGLTSSSTYDPMHGRVLTNTDMNGNTTSFTYDHFGRPLTVTGPYDQGGPEPTISFEYHHDADPAWALTSHLDRQGDPIQTALFVDGVERVVQTKKDATVFVAQGAAPEDVMVVSGQTVFDFAGRVVELNYPITEALGTAGVFNPGIDGVPPTTLTYDVQDRLIEATLPSGNTSTVQYGFGTDGSGLPMFESTVTDPLGAMTKIYRDVTEAITTVKRYHNGSPLLTTYGYNALRTLTSITDHEGNVISTDYDNFGRRLFIDHPDAGRTEVVYDLASNIISRTTSNLAADGQEVELDYDYNRLIRISYPDFPQNDIQYTWGGPGLPNNLAGKMVSISDQSGSEVREYGKLGEITKEVKTFDSDTQGQGPNSPEVYTTEYAYDTWGRLRTLTYPDLEALTYEYDSGGRLRRATGIKGPFTYEYLKRLEYDKFGQRQFMHVGNDIKTLFAYEPLDRRVASIMVGKNLNTPFQNSHFTYDAVGNLLSVVNDVPLPPNNESGGPVSQTFEYDDLYRLTNAEGVFTISHNRESEYELALTYDNIHNITRKTQLHEIVVNGNIRNEQRKTSYDWFFTYDGPHPHAATGIGDRTFSYDANGNQTGWESNVNGTNRTIVWDEENRPQSIFDNGHEKTYKYDHTGRRVMKRGPQGETAYINQYYTSRNRSVRTKHVWMGSRRIASKGVKQQASETRDWYFYNTDHPATGRYITDHRGDLFEHVEFFPHGEGWVAEKSAQRTPYLVGSYEFDGAVGLSYNGDRYYDPRTAAWLSPDVAMKRYIDGYSNGGVYNPKNLSVYSFGYQNPLKFASSEGSSVETVWETLNLTGGVVAFMENLRQGNFWATGMDAVGISVDISPARDPGVGSGIGAGAAASDVADANIGGKGGAGAADLPKRKKKDRTGDPVEHSGSAAEVATLLRDRTQGSTREDFDQTMMPLTRALELQLRVAEQVGGRVAKTQQGIEVTYQVQGVGGARPDVIGPAGELIVVVEADDAFEGSRGIAARIRDLRRVGAATGVEVQAYFERGTSAASIRATERFLGQENVRVYEP